MRATLVLLAVVVAGPVLVVGPGAVARAGPPLPGDRPDYAAGPYADRLCPPAPGAWLCGVERTGLAALQGFQRRHAAVLGGGTCERQSGLWVCFDVDSPLVRRGGTTYGDTFLTARPREVLSASLVAHEKEHVRQWRLYGPAFSLLYVTAGSDACSNYFEQTAGLGAGGYSCP